MRSIEVHGRHLDIPCTADDWGLNDPKGVAVNELTAALYLLVMEVAQRIREGYSVNRAGTLRLYERFFDGVVNRSVEPDDFDPRNAALYYIDLIVGRLS